MLGEVSSEVQMKGVRNRVYLLHTFREVKGSLGSLSGLPLGFFICRFELKEECFPFLTPG